MIDFLSRFARAWAPQPSVRRELAAIVKVAKIAPLQPEDGGQLGADALEFEQHPPGRRWRGGLWRGEQRVALGLGLLDLIKQQFEPIEVRARIWVLRCTGKGRPSRVVSLVERVGADRGATARNRRCLGKTTRRARSLDAIDVLVPARRSALRARGRGGRRSSSGVGAATIAHTRGSRRAWPPVTRGSRAYAVVTPVLSRCRRRDVAIDDGSTTWLPTPSLCSTR